MRSKGIALSSVLIVAFGLTALSTGAAQADSTVTLSQLPGFHQMAIDCFRACSRVR